MTDERFVASGVSLSVAQREKKENHSVGGGTPEGGRTTHRGSSIEGRCTI